MGLENNTFDNSGTRIYLSIIDGKITQKLEDGTTRTFDRLSGDLVDIYYKEDGRFGPTLLVTLRDLGQDYSLQMFWNSGHAKQFAMIIKNAALAERMTLIPTWKFKDPYPDLGMIIRQSNGPLKWYYTRDNPNGLPALIPCQIQTKSGHLKDGWNGNERNAFLINMLKELAAILPNKSLIENRENIDAVNGNAGGQNFNNPNPGAADDLPF